MTEHVVSQDLAYYLAHVLRAAAWLAEFRGRFLTSFRLKELCRTVDYGVPPEALSFFEVCREHVLRSWVSQVQDSDYAKLLARLEKPLAEDLEHRLSVKRDRRHRRELQAALVSGVVDNTDQTVWFDRMLAPSDARRILERVLDSAGPSCTEEREGMLQIGRWRIQFTAEPLRDAVESKADLVLSGSPLPEQLQSSWRAQHAGLLGSEEFVVLVTQLSGKSWAQQDLILETLAKLRRVCHRNAIEALAAEVNAGWSQNQDGDGQFREAAAPNTPARSPDVAQGFVDKLTPFLAWTQRVVSQGRDAASGALEAHELQALTTARFCLMELQTHIGKMVAGRSQLTRELDGLESSEGWLRIWRDRGSVCLELIREIEERQGKPADVIGRVNKLGRECMDDRWTDLTVDRGAR